MLIDFLEKHLNTYTLDMIVAYALVSIIVTSAYLSFRVIEKICRSLPSLCKEDLKDKFRSVKSKIIDQFNKIKKR